MNFPRPNVLVQHEVSKGIEAFKRFDRGCKPRPASEAYPKHDANSYHCGLCIDKYAPLLPPI